MYYYFVLWFCCGVLFFVVVCFCDWGRKMSGSRFNSIDRSTVNSRLPVVRGRSVGKFHSPKQLQNFTRENRLPAAVLSGRKRRKFLCSCKQIRIESVQEDDDDNCHKCYFQTFKKSLIVSRLFGQCRFVSCFVLWFPRSLVRLAQVELLRLSQSALLDLGHTERSSVEQVWIEWSWFEGWCMLVQFSFLGAQHWRSHALSRRQVELSRYRQLILEQILHA